MDNNIVHILVSVPNGASPNNFHEKEFRPKLIAIQDNKTKNAELIYFDTTEIHHQDPIHTPPEANLFPKVYLEDRGD